MNNKALNITLICLTICASLVIFVFVEVCYIQKPPVVQNTTYADKIVLADGTEKNFLELNKFENKDNNGASYFVYELRINAYKDIEKRYAQGFGIQWVDWNNNGKFGEKKVPQYLNNNAVVDPEWVIEPNEIIFYNTDINYSFGVIDEFVAGRQGTPLIFSAGGRTFKAILSGEYQNAWKEFVPMKAVGHVFTGLFTGYNWKEKAYKEYTNTVKFTIEDFFLDSMNLAVSSKGYGKYDLEAYTVNQYFSVEIHDTTVFGGDGFGPIEQTKFQSNSNFFHASVAVNKKGLTSARESLFGMVSGNAGFDTSQTGGSNEFYDYRVNIKLNVDDFDKAYSVAREGYLLTLKVAKMNALENNPSLNIDIALDISGLNIVGLNGFALAGVKLNSIAIISNAPQGFYLGVHSLWDTELKSLSTTSNITIIKDADAFNGGDL